MIICYNSQQECKERAWPLQTLKCPFALLCIYVWWRTFAFTAPLPLMRTSLVQTVTSFNFQAPSKVGIVALLLLVFWFPTSLKQSSNFSSIIRSSVIRQLHSSSGGDFMLPSCVEYRDWSGRVICSRQNNVRCVYWFALGHRPARSGQSFRIGALHCQEHNFTSVVWNLNEEITYKYQLSAQFKSQPLIIIGNVRKVYLHVIGIPMALWRALKQINITLNNTNSRTYRTVEIGPHIPHWEKGV